MSISAGSWRNVNFSVSPSQVGIGEQICLTNTSQGTWHEEAVTYEWILRNTGEVLSTDDHFDTPLCVSYDTAGRYNFRLVATSQSGSTRGRNRSATVVGNQQINAIASPTAVIGASRVTLTAETENIDDSTLVWTSPIDGTTKRGRTVSFDIPAQTIRNRLLNSR